LSDGHIYFPTAHEDTMENHQFDVEIYNYGNNLNNKINYTSYDVSSSVNVIHASLNLLKNIKVKMLDNAYSEMEYDKSINSFYYKQDNEYKKNHNLFIS